MPPIIRSRAAADLPALQEAMWQVHSRDLYPAQWPADPAAFIAPPDTLGAWVAVLNGEVVGQVILGELREPLPAWAAATGLQAAEIAVLARLFVAPAGRGQGVARALFRHAWAEAERPKPAGLGRRAILDVQTKNVAAVALYEAEGWQRVATLDAPFADTDGSTPQVHVYVSPEVGG